MNTGRSRQAWKLGALQVLAVVQGSSAASALQSFSASSVPVAPLPAETAQIATRSAPHVLAAVRAWWGRLSVWSNSAMRRATPW